MSSNIRYGATTRSTSVFVTLGLAAGTVALAAPLSAECTSVALPTSPAAGARFGSSISWNGDLAIVGAPQDRNLGGSTVVGAVYLYHRVGSTWTLEARFEGDGWNGVLGESVAISYLGLAAAGRPSSNAVANPGQVRTYVRNAVTGTWTSSNTITYGGLGYQSMPTALTMESNDLMIGLGAFAFSGYGDFLHERYNPGA